MTMRFVAAGLAAGAALVLIPAGNAAATFMGYTEAGVGPSGIPFTEQTATTSPFGLTSDIQNTTGGHGYGNARLDFLAGTVQGRVHGCAGGPVNDTGHGTSQSRATNETLTVRSDTLPTGTTVQITFCTSFSAEISGSVQDPALVGNSFSRAQGSFRLDGQILFSAGFDSTQEWASLPGTGDFTGQQGNASLVRTATFGARVGESFTISLSATAYAIGSVTGRAGRFPQSSGSAGYAMTFGLGDITSGARLEWQGQSWFGSCAGAGGLIPPNPIDPPVPAPGGVALAGAAMLAVTRRKR